MNEINVKRLLLGGLAAFLTWVVSEIFVEQIVGRVLFGDLIEGMWLRSTVFGDWTGLNHLLNIGIALLNSTVLIWL